MRGADCLPEQVRDLFCGETGYQTPKLETRAAVFEDGKILLVREKNGKWSLPGGWVDVDQSVASNAVKEAREEAGLEVRAVRLIAIQDRRKHNLPEYIPVSAKCLCCVRPWAASFRKIWKPRRAGSSA